MYPNSGGYIGYIDYIIDLYSNAIAIQAKSDCADDQGELIKALARNHSAFQIDHQAVIFQTLFGSAKHARCTLKEFDQIVQLSPLLIMCQCDGAQQQGLKPCRYD
jgi:hypothetical protein